MLQLSLCFAWVLASSPSFQKQLWTLKLWVQLVFGAMSYMLQNLKTCNFRTQNNFSRGLCLSIDILFWLYLASILNWVLNHLTFYFWLWWKDVKTFLVYLQHPIVWYSSDQHLRLVDWLYKLLWIRALPVRKLKVQLPVAPFELRGQLIFWSFPACVGAQALECRNGFFTLILLGKQWLHYFHLLYFILG